MIEGALPDGRRRERRQRSTLSAEAPRVRADETARKLSRKFEPAAAFRYLWSRRAAFTAASTTAARRSTTIPSNVRRAASRSVARVLSSPAPMPTDGAPPHLYSLIEIAKLNRFDPQARITDVLARISDHSARHIADFPPWNRKPAELIPHCLTPRPRRAGGTRRRRRRLQPPPRTIAQYPHAQSTPAAGNVA
jgi:hypothetical protein